MINHAVSTNIDELLDILSIIISAYDEARPYYDSHDEFNQNVIGYLMKIDNKTFSRCCDILNEYRPIDQPPRPVPLTNPVHMHLVNTAAKILKSHGLEQK